MAEGIQTDIGNAVSEIASFVTKYHGTHVLTVEHDGVKAPVLLYPTGAGMQLTSVKQHLDQYRDRPERKSGTATLGDLASFVLFVNEHKDGDSRLFASLPKDIPTSESEAPTITAVLDYNEANISPATPDDPTPGRIGAPRFGKHRATYRFQLSPEWATWAGASGKWQEQKDFVKFLRDNMFEVEDPDQIGAKGKAIVDKLRLNLATHSDLHTVASELEINVKSVAKNVENTDSGEVSIAFETEHTTKTKGGGIVKVPNAFLVSIPVFAGGSAYQLVARLSYKLGEGGKVQWSYELQRLKYTYLAAHKEAVEEIGKQTGIQPFIGSPEA